MRAIFNTFTRFNLIFGQYLLYVYLIVLTLVVIIQINNLNIANSKIVELSKAKFISIDSEHDNFKLFQSSIQLRMLKHDADNSIQDFRILQLESKLNKCNK